MPGRSIGKQEERDPLVLGRVGIGASHQDAPVAVAPAAAPHLLAVDHEVVAVELGSGGQAGQIAACARLAEQLAPHVVGPQRGSEVPFLLLVGAEAEQRAGSQHQPDHVEHRRHACQRTLVLPRRVVFGGEAAAAVLDRPMDARVPGVVDRSLPGNRVADQSGGQIAP